MPYARGDTASVAGFKALPHRDSGISAALFRASTRVIPHVSKFPGHGAAVFAATEGDRGSARFMRSPRPAIVVKASPGVAGGRAA